MKYAIIILTFLVSCAHRKPADGTQTVDRYSFTVASEYPHDTGAYTQGLFWSDGSMWESTGEYGSSTLRETALETGAVERQNVLADDFFAEGATLVDNKIYQLTWLEQTAFVYDARSMALLETKSYKGQGWGLTTDGSMLYLSDGTANISIVDPATFAVKSTIVVRREGKPLELINELEWIDGRIWANVYLSNTVVVIDPASGRVEAEIDFSALTARLEITAQTDVMNGIAHDPKTGKIWVTGKNWDRLFEVEVAR